MTDFEQTLTALAEVAGTQRSFQSYLRGDHVKPSGDEVGPTAGSFVGDNTGASLAAMNRAKYGPPPKDSKP